MRKTCRWRSSLFLLFALCPSAAVGQYLPSTPGLEAPRHDRGVPVAVQTRDPTRTYAHKLAGLGAGVTVSAIVFSLDDVLGSSCFGSGDYLTLCRVGFVSAAAVGGGLGALAGMMIKGEHPPGRVSRILVGSALGSISAFLVSNVGCEQEDQSNPEILCGYDGMVSTRAIVGGSLVGGVVGGLLGGGSEGLRIRHLGPIPQHDGRVAVEAAFSWQRR